MPPMVATTPDVIDIKHKVRGKGPLYTDIEAKGKRLCEIPNVRGEWLWVAESELRERPWDARNYVIDVRI